MALNRDDVLFSEGQLRVRGKGNKLRLLPLAPETTQLLAHYLRVERPDPCSAALFVVLKGPARGQRMTPAGLRSLFRHHRRTTGVQLANPHRFRHTFASDTYATEMLRSGVSFPVLMKLLGHVDPGMTMRYVDVALTDLEREFQLARSKPRHLAPQPKTSTAPVRAGLYGLIDSLTAAQHVIEMFRRSLPNGIVRNRLLRLSKRLIKILAEIRKLHTT
jgi:integrase